MLYFPRFINFLGVVEDYWDAVLVNFLPCHYYYQAGWCQVSIIKLLALVYEDSQEQDVRQSLTEIGFPPSIKNNPHIYSYVSLFNYFGASVKGGTKYKNYS